MGNLELNILDAVKRENGVLLYRVCVRSIIVYQNKALKNAYLKDKIYLRHDLNRLIKRKNKTIITNKPDIFASKFIKNTIDKGIYALINTNNMSRLELVIFLNFNPDIKISHWLFESGEYIWYDECKGVIKDKDNNIFEDWSSENECNGIRIRDTDSWLSGWYVK